ncbi:MAG TPA: pantoate--beta-alanine ligase [Puia sp.]|uniref:pantoate--beta-alanine ligase n=1 Tax=Puia sp. TaxID=2045100 RepID=UPI002CE42CE5|nr:pantoate--beta-alanine ligase [Puia sp.]HVU97813.1 pantoate--beta-alanine ligase [Puia sp.]
MIMYKRAADLAMHLEKQRKAGRSIGFVPTMGALHEGHISLIAISKRSTDLTVCSIFVNPTQFNDPKDFQKYPITLEKDIPMLEKAGVDVLFLPEVAEMYPHGTRGLETYDLGPLETLLEGKFRPGHFQGVCQVMRRLLEKVHPDQLFMGSKDYQQCMVVRRLLTIMGLPTTLHCCPIIREADGLAMSSRNLRLTPEQRANATAIYRALMQIKTGFTSGPVPTLIENAIRILESAGFRVDYVSIADANTLEPIPGPSPSGAIALIAAFQGDVRLIDNMIL